MVGKLYWEQVFFVLFCFIFFFFFFLVKTLNELMEFQKAKLQVYLGSHELSHLFRAKRLLEEYLRIKLEREAELEGLCLLK